MSIEENVIAMQPNPTLPTDSKDVAWVTIPAYQQPEVLAKLCQDVEAILRVNPYYKFKEFCPTNTGFHTEFENSSNEQTPIIDIEVTQESGNLVVINYQQGLKKRTLLNIEPYELGSRLVLVDDYESIPETERQNRQAEVDKSITAWGEGLRMYFLHLKRYSWIPGWRWYMRRCWIPLQPFYRRVLWWLFLFTVIDFAVIALGFAIYYVEFAK